ncbi:methyl-viologen-reducing hydrogenase subunit delta [Desulfosporosinus sp. Tol-M]|nr:methyl-viologen-reducing hydrogenase subunit delta [Desulfosporosinus sp. Tol-M]
MCTGRVDLSFVLRAFLKGLDGVFVGGCQFNDCSYGTQGNYHALNMVLLCKKIMEHIGLNPGRLRLETMSAGDGILFTELMNDFGKQVRGFGPLGKGEGIDENVLKSRIQAAADIVPFIRLVERERMRLPVQSAEVYYNFFNSDEFSKLFKETVLEKLVDSQIISLLRERPRTSGEIVKVLELTPSEVSRHLNITLRQGLVRYEESEKRFAIA